MTSTKYYNKERSSEDLRKKLQNLMVDTSDKGENLAEKKSRNINDAENKSACERKDVDAIRTKLRNCSIESSDDGDDRVKKKLRNVRVQNNGGDRVRKKLGIVDVDGDKKHKAQKGKLRIADEVESESVLDQGNRAADPNAREPGAQNVTSDYFLALELKAASKVSDQETQELPKVEPSKENRSSWSDIVRLRRAASRNRRRASNDDDEEQPKSTRFYIEDSLYDSRVYPRSEDVCKRRCWRLMYVTFVIFTLGVIISVITIVAVTIKKKGKPRRD